MNKPNLPVAEFNRVLRSALQCPDLTVAPYLVTPEGRLAPDMATVTVDDAARTAHLALRYVNGIEEDIFVRVDGADTVWQRRTENRSADTRRLVELGIRLEGIALGGARDQDYFYHPENPRIYQKMAIPVRLKRSADMVSDSGFDAVAGNKWADPGVVSERVGASPYQPFPAVVLSNYATPDGLVHGSLSQRVCYHNHLFTHLGRGVAWDLLSSFKAIPHLELPPGGVIEDRWYLGRTTQAHDLERVFEGYTRVLRHHLPPLHGAGPANRHTVIWGSWNDGIFIDFDQGRLFAQAEFIRDNLPTVEWMQVDAGYAVKGLELGHAHGLSMPYEEDGLDRAKFPDGFKAFTDGVRERGLKPGVWIGGFVPGRSRLHDEHPDWFVDYSYRVSSSFVLDVSKPEVRDYMRRALDCFTTEGGFEAIKLDFWSYAFEDSHPLLAGHAASAYQWRSWWCGEMRKRLPDNGYLQTGCDIAMGNPFLAEWFNNYRYGIDISGGEWEHVRTNILWGAACFATHTGDLFVPNSDSIGLLPGLSDDEALTCITYCLISRSLVEVSGWLYQHPDHPRLAWVKKALCCPNNGQDVSFAGYDYRDDAIVAPPIWFLRTPHFSLLEGQPGLPLRTVAVFNLADDPRTFTLTAEALGLPAGEYTVTDVWSLESADMRAFSRFELGGRRSRLLAVSPKADRLEVLDANIKTESVHPRGTGLALHFAHAGDLDLILSRSPRVVRLNAEPLATPVAAGSGNWRLRVHIPTRAVLEIECNETSAVYGRTPQP